MQTNSSGQVAIAKYQTIPGVVKVKNTAYAFVVRANICLAWINPEHVGTVLSKRKECCSGSKKPMFRYANENEVRIWTVGGGR